MYKIQIGKQINIKRKRKVAFMVSFPLEFYQEYTKTCLTMLQDEFKQSQKEHINKGKYLANLLFRFGHNGTDFMENNYTGVWEAWEIKISRITKSKYHAYNRKPKPPHIKRIFYTFNMEEGTYKKHYVPDV